MLIGYKGQAKLNLDSLKNLIHQAKDDSNKVNLYYLLHSQYPVYESNENVVNLLKGLVLSKKIKYHRGTLKHYLVLSKIFFYKSLYHESLKYSYEYLDFCDKNNFISEKKAVYNNIGNLLTKEGNYDEAKKYYYLVLQENANTNDYYELSGAYTNLALLSIELNQLDSGIIYLNKSRSLQKKGNLLAAYANSSIGLSEIFLKKNLPDTALSLAKEGMEIYKLIPEVHGITNSFFAIASAYLAAEKINLAENHFLIAYKRADSLQNKRVKRDCALRLSEIYVNQNKYKQAYEFNQIAQKIEGELAFEKEKGKMLQAEVKNELIKTENSLKEKEAEVIEKNREKKYLYTLLIGLAILLFLAYRAYAQKKKSNTLISEQKKLVEDKQKEILDSIQYAQRIQSAQIPSEKMVAKILSKIKKSNS